MAPKAEAANGVEKTLLSEDQKKSNHIRSEQKRREAIREGFDKLAAVVPGLDGMGRSEALVLEGALKLAREEVVKRRDLIAQAKQNGEDTTGLELDTATIEAVEFQLSRAQAEGKDAEQDTIKKEK
ncbi:hypothetical protein BU24DRAFT_460927 [Aaosphaeria arxii CBS 175.79]|uniref:BHLH domain-containing protein n=1 Tax=Aaosphaeria arxii CBS 175.79 TaxID=1450172 RepID=A0A6A5XYP4_9PLEO|nr:uncharacterized protein BU24DRAFT_460927 [Aaosphaeria arxii CBS 175.79]KAF2017937.1 hypothetical protein BU24DRAFT_460927 [Aaosphaeria arxii CBS 175.79]